MPRVDGFPFVHRETVRFRDLDAFGHVNNAVYDYAAGATMELPDEWRRSLAA
jgi:acyl-ACP thioesterase